MIKIEENLIQYWQRQSDEMLIHELRNPARGSCPETYLPIVIEALARILEKLNHGNDG